MSSHPPGCALIAATRSATGASTLPLRDLSPATRGTRAGRGSLGFGGPGDGRRCQSRAGTQPVPQAATRRPSDSSPSPSAALHHTASSSLTHTCPSRTQRGHVFGQRHARHYTHKQHITVLCAPSFCTSLNRTATCSLHSTVSIAGPHTPYCYHCHVIRLPRGRVCQGTYSPQSAASPASTTALRWWNALSRPAAAIPHQLYNSCRTARQQPSAAAVGSTGGAGAPPLAVWGRVCLGRSSLTAAAPACPAARHEACVLTHAPSCWSR